MLSEIYPACTASKPLILVSPRAPSAVGEPAADVSLRDRSERPAGTLPSSELSGQPPLPRHLPHSPGGSPPGPALPGFFLFSAPSRRTLSSLAVVRAQLVERLGPTSTRPAKHAVVEVLAPGQSTWIGIADAHGAAVVIFPYPSFATNVAPQSPPSHPGEARAQSWDLTVRVSYRPASQAKPDSIAALPDLGAILVQPAAQLWLSHAGPGQPYLSTRLVFGQPITLQTAGTSELWIEA